MAQEFVFSSELEIPVHDFLRTLSMVGVNAELSPLVKMTAPQGWEKRPILDWPEKQYLFKSWILLLGFLPIDRHSFYFESIRPDGAFIERSSSVSNSFWRHERKIIPVQSGCRVTDSIEYQSRIPVVDLLLKPMYRMVFYWRHRNLKLRYGSRGR